LRAWNAIAYKAIGGWQIGSDTSIMNGTSTDMTMSSEACGSTRGASSLSVISSDFYRPLT